MRVALTFDAEYPGRPSPPGVDEHLLDILRRAGIRATFFLQGRWVRSSPNVACRIADAGHEVGNHSHYHAPMDGLTKQAFRHDVRRAEEAIVGVTGVDPRPWFRCPFGSGMDSSKVLATLEELGYKHVGWDVDSLDWSGDRDPKELLDSVVEETLAREADTIVLMHGWPGATAQSLGSVLERLAAAEVEFIGVEALESVVGSAVETSRLAP
jgi:peptidoglycan-N-acetylglucosamine deacetylase